MKKYFFLLLLGCTSLFAQTHITVSNCDIQTAINNCHGSCTISVTAGTCNLTGNITWAGTGKRINLECAGRQQTVLVCPPGLQCISVDSNSRIAHCDLRGAASAAISAIVNGQQSSHPTSDVVIEDNVIEKSAGQGLNTGGGASRWTIRGNLLQKNVGDGIFLASGSRDSLVADNVVINNGSNGIDCNGSGNSFHGNVSSYNGLPGGAIDRNGILISGIANGSSANHNSIVGNETNYNGGSGINVRADSGTTANFNIIAGNVSHDNSGTNNNGDGISIDGSDLLGTWIGNTVVGNTVYHNQRYGIMIDGENAETIQSTVISGNVAMANGNTGIIVANPKAQDNLIVNNMAMSNGNAQITDLGSTRAVIAGNKESAADSSYVVKNPLVASTITSQSPGISFQTSGGNPGATMSDSGAWSFPAGLNIGTGISNDGTGLKHQSVSTGTLGPLAAAVITLTWSTPFSDSSYDPQCSVVDSAATRAGLRIQHIRSFSPNVVNVLVMNDDSTQAHTGTMYCLGIHQGPAN